MQDIDKAQKLQRQWMKLQMADHVLLMQDNQQVLATSTAADRALRQQHHRLRETQLKSMTESQKGLEFPDDSMGDIRIDSPQEIHHHYPTPSLPATPPQLPATPPQQSSAVPGLLGRLLPWVMAGALGVGGAGAAWLLKPTDGANTSTTTRSGFLLKLVEPELKK